MTLSELITESMLIEAKKRKKKKKDASRTPPVGNMYSGFRTAVAVGGWGAYLPGDNSDSGDGGGGDE